MIGTSEPEGAQSEYLHWKAPCSEILADENIRRARRSANGPAPWRSPPVAVHFPLVPAPAPVAKRECAFLNASESSLLENDYDLSDQQLLEGAGHRFPRVLFRDHLKSPVAETFALGTIIQQGDTGSGEILRGIRNSNRIAVASAQPFGAYCGGDHRYPRRHSLEDF